MSILLGILGVVAAFVGLVRYMGFLDKNWDAIYYGINPSLRPKPKPKASHKPPTPKLPPLPKGNKFTPCYMYSITPDGDYDFPEL